MECNPLNINDELLSICKNFNCNRISMGVQSFSDVIVEAINRGEQSRRVLHKALDCLEEMSFNVSIDLINGLPGLDVEEEIIALDELLKKYSSINHLSFYDLSIDEGSNYYGEREKINFPDELTLARYESEIKDTLLKYNFKRYEISNYCKRGFESSHNLGYWRYRNYIGLGPGAHSTLGNLRVENLPDIKLYIDGRDYSNKHILSRKEQIEEYLLMGMRLMDGLSLDDFFTRFAVKLPGLLPETIDFYLKKGELEHDSNEGKIRLTERGIDILNSILVDMFIELDRVLGV